MRGTSFSFPMNCPEKKEGSSTNESSTAVTTTTTNNFERMWVNEDGGKGEGWGVGNVVSKRGHPGV